MPSYIKLIDRLPKIYSIRPVDAILFGWIWCGNKISPAIPTTELIYAFCNKFHLTEEYYPADRAKVFYCRFMSAANQSKRGGELSLADIDVPLSHILKFTMIDQLFIGWYECAMSFAPCTSLETVVDLFRCKFHLTDNEEFNIEYASMVLRRYERNPRVTVTINNNKLNANL